MNVCALGGIKVGIIAGMTRLIVGVIVIVRVVVGIINIIAGIRACI